MKSTAALQLDATVIVTTSAVPSHPSTALLDATLASLSLCTGAIERCHLIITCDGYQLSDAETSQYKWGRLTRQAAEAYEAFVGSVRDRAARGEMGARRVTVLALPSHCGFGRAVKAALTHVTTELVLVLQHDWLFVAPGFDAAAASAAVLGPLRLPYVAAMSQATVDYPERARRRYGLEIAPATVFASDDTVDGGGDGCGGCGGGGGGSGGGGGDSVGSVGGRGGGGGAPRRFWPLLLLQDKPHLASAAYLRDFVYGQEHCPPVGGFPEDGLGQVQLADIRANGMVAHARYRTFVLDQGSAVTYHISGRKMRAAPPCAAGGGASGAKATPDAPDAAPAAADGAFLVACTVLGEAAPPPEGADCGAHPAGFVRGAAWGSAVVAGLDRVRAPAAAGTRPFRGRCFACGQKGHSKDHCPSWRRADLDGTG